MRRLRRGVPLARLARRRCASASCCRRPERSRALDGDTGALAASRADEEGSGSRSGSAAGRGAARGLGRRLAGDGAAAAGHTDENEVGGGAGWELPSLPLPHDHPSTSPSDTLVDPAPLDDHDHPPEPLPRQ